MMSTTTEYPPVDWTKPIMLEGHGTLLRAERYGKYWRCEQFDGDERPTAISGKYLLFYSDGSYVTGHREWRVVNVPETPDLSQQAAVECARLANVVAGADTFTPSHFGDDCPYIAISYSRTIELCLKHLDALPDELREHIRPLSDEERVRRDATKWADCEYVDDASKWLAARAGFIAGAGHKAAQS